MSSDLKSKFHQNNLNGANPSHPSIYGFEDYRFDVGHLMLYRFEEEVPLTPKQAETLLALVEQRGEIVSKDALMDRLWGDAAVEESNLIQNIYVLRKILGAMRDGRPMIETLRRRGYRFNAELTDHKHRSPLVSAAIRLESIAAVQHPADSNISAETVKNISVREWSIPKIVARIAAIALLVMLTVGAYFVFLSKPMGPVNRKLAVLPLQAMDPADKNLFLGIGIADSLINRFNSAQGLTVRSLGSVRKYSEIEPDPVAAGLEQKVDYILASCYQLANGQIRVTSNLVNVASGKVEESYSSVTDAANLFSAQDAIAQDLGNKVLAALGSDALEPQVKRGTNNQEAYAFYMMAMNLSEERGVEKVQKALEYLDRAVTLDPNYAPAWAAKAHTHRDIASHSNSDQHEQYRRSMDAIAKARAIDPNLSEAYSALCHNKNRYEYDAAGAETACKRALTLDPNSSLAHKTYANFLYSRGRFDEAIGHIRTAMDLQPVSYRNQQIYALALYYAQRYDEAEAQFKRLIELNPSHTHIHKRLIMVLEQQGKTLEALEYLDKMLVILKDDKKLRHYRAAYQASGWRGVLIEQIKADEAEAREGPFDLARSYVKIGDQDKALDQLEKAYRERSQMMAVLKVEPQLGPLHNHPRFADLVKRIEENVHRPLPADVPK
jgi:DNA-binding winged helix-turn-helix (wHTH) protein/tetratricopeptide (TPR) repeat protein